MLGKNEEISEERAFSQKAREICRYIEASESRESLVKEEELDLLSYVDYLVKPNR